MKTYYPEISGVETDKWVGNLLKVVIPILYKPIDQSKYIVGTGFLLAYDSNVYLLTAKHVIDKTRELNSQPFFLISYIDETNQIVSEQQLLNGGNKWLYSTPNDLALITWKNVQGYNKKPDVGSYQQRHLSEKLNFNSKESVILGYPFGDTSLYKSGKKSFFPQKFQTIYHSMNIDNIIVRLRHTGNMIIFPVSNKPGGISGGPLVLNNNGEGRIIGVCSRLMKIDNPTLAKLVRQHKMKKYLSKDYNSNFVICTQLHHVLKLIRSSNKV